MLAKMFTLVLGLFIAQAIAAPGTGPEIAGAWARATPGRAENGAVYLTIVSQTPDRLVRVSTPVAKKAELHSMSTEGGVMKMRPLDGIDIPAGKKVTLGPRGMHIMLQGLNEPLRQGQSFPLTLNFEKAGPREVTVPVEGAAAMGPPGQGAAGASTPMHH